MRTRPAPRAARLALGLSLATLTMAAADVSAMSFIRVVDVNNPVTADPGHANPHYFGAAWADYDQMLEDLPNELIRLASQSRFKDEAEI